MEKLTLQSGDTVCLGRIRPVRTFNAGRFRVLVYPGGRTAVVPLLDVHYAAARDESPPPTSLDWSPAAAAALARMYLNDRLGDCVIAGKAHAVGVWSGNESGAAIQATDAEIDRDYISICGPGDQGCMIPAVLDAMVAGQFTMAGKAAKLDAYVAVDWTNQLMVQVALEVFGSISIGINLTSDCENAGPGVVWNFAGQIVGGHDVTLYGYSSSGVLLSTWGRVGTLIPWPVFLRDAGNGPGVEEAYVMLSPNWYAKANLAPNGIDAATLKADLALVGQGQVPPLGPPSPPPPPPPNIVAVPNVVGMTEAAAAAALAAVGLQVNVPLGTPATAAVVSQSPAAGAQVPNGSTVFLTFAPPPPPPPSGLAVTFSGAVPAGTYSLTPAAHLDAVTLPPWLVSLLRVVCASPQIPPWARALCALLPAGGPCP